MKAALEERTDVCYLVHVTSTCYGVPTGKLLLIGQSFVVVQTGQRHVRDARASRPRTPRGQVITFGQTVLMLLLQQTTAQP